MTAGTGYKGSKYNRTSTVGIQTLTVNGFDLRDYLVKFTMYEDIFSHTTTIEVILSDQGSITEDPGIFTGETLNLTFTTEKANFTPISKTFKVYRIEVPQPGRAGSKNRLLTLHGTTEPAFTNLERRMSRAYIDLTEDQIVADILENVLGIGNFETEPAKYERRFVVPNWRPFDVIQEMCRSGVRASGYEATTFLFFEGRDEFKFVTLDKLIEEAAAGDVTVKISAAYKPEEYALMNARNFSQNSPMEYFRSGDKGMFGTKFHGVNLSEKLYEQFEYVYSSEFDQQTKIDGNNIKLTPNDPTFSEQKNITGAMEKFPKNDHSSHFADKRVFKRTGMIEQYSNYQYAVDVDGNSNLPFPCIVRFELPSFDARGDKKSDSGTVFEQKEDKYLSGNYLVAQIVHEVNPKEHRMTLGLIKPHLLPGEE